MDLSRIQHIIEKISIAKIAVYGDFCLDSYWIMDKRGSEISIETGLQAQAVATHYYTPGGAANVVANLSALNPAEIRVIGTIGDDMQGRELRSQLEKLGANTTALFVQKEHFNTYSYLKRLVDGQEEPRIDFGVYNERSTETDQKLLAAIEQALQESDAVIFNQQVTGSINNESFIGQANTLFEKYNNKIVMLDSRHFNDRFKNTFLKCNDREIASLNGQALNPDDNVPITDVKKYGREVYEKYKKPVFVTCGERGIIAFDKTGAQEVQGLQLKSKLDTVGAGDTAISAITLCLAAGFNSMEAATFGNFAAAVTVQKLYTTGTANAQEILSVSQDPDFIYNADLAENERSAVYLQDSEFELCEPNVLEKLGQIRYAVFDHDGTISSLRQGWEEIMEPVMMKAILGKHYGTVDAHAFHKVLGQVKEFIHKTTGIQTIYQMEGLVNLVRECGYVPEHEILDKFQYKALYNDGLMEMVNKRMEKLAAGELGQEDYTMKGAVAFLQELKERGIIMYLASGTDAEDVKHEAEMLGYAHLFDGGIYGALKDYTKFSKKMIIEKIIKDNNLQGNELAVFGDGPDEIREGRRAGGIAVGITSNEVQRFGHNPAKRPRLVKAGAHLLIPDFSQYKKLITLLFQENVKYADA
ncbi:PfkB family carbohydrate kinase [Dyadobacter chenwenxiniae]|uniref:PfkB family carbohydrate kinase n=1 Tax=Dyadobacter chenwenxiniae TaxID=2906456 RepID=A0A9X1PKI7_9BACT|nr:PfkB family carbohydrate kinase [Dyadobacter chenwenxiniae]MCF0061634.1 PfkB family carbohydrate kinase [Dyadobacter chenwenxiniae]UON81455.1 PfkB family carbohydrate kinase [Dyadobacter chenwenxiniae]